MAPSSHDGHSPMIHRQSSESLDIPTKTSGKNRGKNRGGQGARREHESNTVFDIRPASKSKRLANAEANSPTIRQKQFEMGQLSEVKERTPGARGSTRGSMGVPPPDEMLNKNTLNSSKHRPASVAEEQ